MSLSADQFIVIAVILSLFGGLAFYFIWANKQMYKKGLHELMDKKKKKREKWEFD
ncbi:unnamed protein product [Paramecium primaurelia]|uniref:Uncharacterized protein n=2 Tax=Paramecium TaxID=5884 RepID=A0A8S1U3J8_9CILI|nr:unnamed protein product [Paramecium primaurelia]CAD8159765.1 unnamed protein product [Paramecium pentaurelia]